MAYAVFASLSLREGSSLSSDLWWVKRYWDGFSFEHCGFPVTAIQPVLYTHISFVCIAKGM